MPPPVIVGFLVMAWVLLAVPALPAAAGVAVLLSRPDGPAAARWAVRATAVGFLSAIGVALTVVAGGGDVEAIWTASDGTALAGLHADRIGAVLALLTTGVGLVVQSFAARALAGDPRERRFFQFSALLTAATTTIALSTTLSGLAVAWLMTGVVLSALVGHRDDLDMVRRAVRRTRSSLLIGDAALVAAVAVALASIGEVDLRDAGQAAQALADSSVGGLSPLVVVALLLVVATISRCALVPLHRWLPATVAAPTPVSALLHAGVINGGGVLLVRSAAIFGNAPVATHVAFAAGVFTAVLATSVMLVRSDVKGNLAWSTSGQMGFMVVQIAVGALPAALFHLVGHGLYKAALFLGSGGAVTRHLQQRQLPAPRWIAPPAVRRTAAVVVPTTAVATGYLLIDPHLPPAGAVLVIVFAWLTAARGVDGWFRSGAFAPLPTALIALVGTTAVVFAYLGGLRAFEGFVAAGLPEELPGTVSPTVLVATLVVLGLIGVAIGVGSGARRRTVRAHLYGLLLSTSSARPVVRPARPGTPRRRATAAPTATGEATSRDTMTRSASPRR